LFLQLLVLAVVFAFVAFCLPFRSAAEESAVIQRKKNTNNQPALPVSADVAYSRSPGHSSHDNDWSTHNDQESLPSSALFRFILVHQAFNHSFAVASSRFSKIKN
jgi:hypothetical protein